MVGVSRSTVYGIEEIQQLTRQVVYLCSDLYGQTVSGCVLWVLGVCKMQNNGKIEHEVVLCVYNLPGYHAAESLQYFKV